MPPSFIIKSHKIKKCFPRLPKLFFSSALLCCGPFHLVQVIFIFSFLWSERQVAEVAEGCRQRERCRCWPGARVCCRLFFLKGREVGDGCCVLNAGHHRCVCVCPVSHGNSWQQVWHVVMGNYAARCKTFSLNGVTQLPGARPPIKAVTFWLPGHIYWCTFTLLPGISQLFFRGNVRVKEFWLRLWLPAADVR